MADACHGRSGQRADGIESKTAPGLQPDLGPDIRLHLATKSNLVDQSSQYLNAITGVAADLSKHEAISLYVPNRSIFENLGRRVDDRPNDMFGTYCGRDCAVRIQRPQRRAAVLALATLEVPPRNSILQCQQRCARIEQPAKSWCECIDLVRFYSEEHDVKGTAQSVRFNEVTVPDFSHLTVKTNHSETIASQFSQARPAVYKGHGVAIVRKCSTKQAADSACAQHAN
jgi:hypothetical protein